MMDDDSDSILGRLRDVWDTDWQPVGNASFVACSGALAVLLAVAARSTQQWVPVLDSANLVFHEAGHPIFSIIGELAEILGGTLMQLLVPLVAGVAFWWKRHTAGCFVSGVWFFENWLNIGRYMSDARAQELPLVGGGEHDWTTLFTRWGVLHRDTVIGGRMRLMGWFGMLAVWCWLAWRWRRSRSAQTRVR